MVALFAGCWAAKRVRTVLSLVLLAGLGLALGGCGMEAVVPLTAIAAGADGMVLNQTGHSASDHIASWMTGQDCSVLRYTKDGRYCMSEAEVAAEQAKLHRPYFGDCYKVRGSVACYNQPDATHTSETTVYNQP